MVTKEYFGSFADGTVYAYTLKNQAGMAVTLLTRGATVQKICVPVNGKTVDICLGFDTIEEYLADTCYLGVVVGRNCNRIGGSRFPLNGKTVVLPANEGENQLHGGPVGFNSRIWAAKAGENSVTFTYHSPDGEGGYPGNVALSVTYTLDEDNGLRLDYTATPDQDTVVNLTNHTYFNLNGGGSVGEHILQLDADAYTPVNAQLIPTGEIAPVDGTAFDFRTPKALGRDMGKIGLYDNNFCLKGTGLRKVATLQGKELTMEVETTCPGMQVYSATFGAPKTGKGGAAYDGNCFVCLETQAYPDALNHPNFPSTLVPAGGLYCQTTVYRVKPNK